MALQERRVVFVSHTTAVTPQTAHEQTPWLWKVAAGMNTSSPHPGTAAVGHRSSSPFPSHRVPRTGRLYHTAAASSPQASSQTTFPQQPPQTPHTTPFHGHQPLPGLHPDPTEAAEGPCEPAARTARWEAAEAPTRERPRLLPPPGPRQERLPPCAQPWRPHTLPGQLLTSLQPWARRHPRWGRAQPSYLRGQGWKDEAAPCTGSRDPRPTPPPWAATVGLEPVAL